VPSLDGSRVSGDNTSYRHPTVTDLYHLIRDGGGGLLCDALGLERSGLLQTLQDPVQRGPGHPQGVSHVTLAGTRAHERIVHRDALDVQGSLASDLLLSPEPSDLRLQFGVGRLLLVVPLCKRGDSRCLLGTLTCHQSSSGTVNPAASSATRAWRRYRSRSAARSRSQ